MLGSVFAGATLDPFDVTFLGNLTVKVPNIVPIVGGSTVGGRSAAISETGAGALVRIPNPFGEDPTVGVAILFTPLPDHARSSLSSVITVTPTQSELSQGQFGESAPARCACAAASARCWSRWSAAAGCRATCS